MSENAISGSANAAPSGHKRLKLNYGESVLSLPKEKLLDLLPSCGEFNLKVLILAASDDGLRADFDACLTNICMRLDCTQSALNKAVEFWSKAGVLSVCAQETAAPVAVTAPEAPKESGAPAAQMVVPAVPAVSTVVPAPATTEAVSAKAVLPSSAVLPSAVLPSALPNYTESRCADIISGSNELADTIDMCQQMIGKIFTPADVAIIVGLFDHLRLGGDYIANLFAYCVGKGKRSLRYIEKTAINLFDEGVDSTDALNAYIKRKENFESNIGKIRSLIGAGERELTPHEKKMFTCWLDDWRFEPDVIKRAYEITVDKIGKVSLAYTNRILENWHASGLTTLESVEASLESYKKNKAEAANAPQTVNGAESGFKTDEFFEAALRRSYKDQKK